MFCFVFGVGGGGGGGGEGGGGGGGGGGGKERKRKRHTHKPPGAVPPEGKVPHEAHEQHGDVFRAGHGGICALRDRLGRRRRGGAGEVAGEVPQEEPICARPEDAREDCEGCLGGWGQVGSQ